MAFGYAVDQRIFIDRVLRMECSDGVTMAIF
jgi:hypothetical protein